MFLIFTADERSWQPRQDLLLLGAWCLTPANRDRLKGLRYEVLPYHWDDRARLRRDVPMLEALYEEALAGLSQQLDEALGAEHSSRFWRIIVGPWLALFITIVYDRFRCLQVAADSGKVTGAYLPRTERGAWLLRDNLEFAHFYDRDDYNQYLTGRIAEKLGGLPAQFVETGTDFSAAAARATMGFGSTDHRKPLRKAVARAAARMTPPFLNRVVLYKTCLSNPDLAKLQLSLGQVPYLLPPTVEAPRNRPDIELRSSLALSLGSGEFEALVSSMIVEELPTLYLEGFEEMMRRALTSLPRKPKVAFTALAYDADEPFKFWAAHHVERGMKLVGTQHGANYGTAAWFQEEDHQVAIYDRFYSWGWTSPSKPNVSPLPAGKFNRARSLLKPRPDGRLMLATFAWPRYAYKLFSVPVATSGTLSYFEEQFRFARALPPEIRRQLLVRLFPNDRYWKQASLWQEACPDVDIYLGTDVPMFSQMNESRLFVTTGNSTPALEALVSDFPTVLLWNPDRFEVREEARPYVDALRHAGILFDSAGAAAQHVSQIFDSPDSWWSLDSVQEARKSFCDRFALASPDWRREWRRELLRLAR